VTRTHIRNSQVFVEFRSAESSERTGSLFPLFSPDALHLGDRLVFVNRDPPEPATVVDLEMKDGVVISVLLQAPTSKWSMTSAELVAEAAVVLVTPDSTSIALLSTPDTTSMAPLASRDASSQAFRTSLKCAPRNLAPFSVDTAMLGDRLLFVDEHPAVPATVMDIVLGNGPWRRLLLKTASGLLEVTADELAKRNALALDRDDPSPTSVAGEAPRTAASLQSRRHAVRVHGHR
jgi:hypothetical protein